MMSMPQILQQQARRILAYSNRNCLFRRSYETLSAANQTLPSHIETDLNQKAHLIPVLDQGHQVNPSYFRGFIKNLHDSKKFTKALEASEWMCKQSVFDVFPEDYAAQLHLVNTVLGLEEAEKLFKNIPEKMRDYSVYSVLLSSYTRSVETLYKAEATFKKMRELGFLLKPSPFNSMICLYGQIRKLDMVEKVIREMKKNNVEVDSLTVNNVLRVYASINTIKEMEKFKTLVDKEEIKLEKDTIVAMAKAYHRAGLIEKAIEVYGDKAGSKREVYRLWNLYKKEGELKDDGYRIVISSLLKLNDVQGAENIYGEWTPKGPKLDMSIPGLLISRFCAEGKAAKVEELIKSIRKKRNMMYLKMVTERLIALGQIVCLVTFIVAIISLIIIDFPHIVFYMLLDDPILYLWLRYIGII